MSQQKMTTNSTQSLAAHTYVFLLSLSVLRAVQVPGGWNLLCEDIGSLTLSNNINIYVWFLLMCMEMFGP